MTRPFNLLVGTEVAGVRLGAALGLAASLVWPLQAALISGCIAGLLDGSMVIPPVLAALSYLVLAAVRVTLEFIADGVLFRTAETTTLRLRRGIVETESRAVDTSAIGGPGAVAALLVEKIEAIRPYIVRYGPARARVMVIPLAILALSAWQSWAVALVLLLAGPLIPVFMMLVGWAARQASERQMAEIGGFNDLLVDRIAALADLQLLDAAPAMVTRFEEASESLRMRTMAVLRLAFLSSSVLELFAALGVAMVAVWVGFSLLGVIEWGAWQSPLTPFWGIFLLLLAPEFFQPMRDLASAWHDKAAAEAVAGELAHWREPDRTMILGTGEHSPALKAPVSVALEGVSVRRGERLMRMPDFQAGPGARLAVIGPSGAGKSTLLRLLAGLEEPLAGVIRVCGHPLDQATADGWRARLGWMPQTPRFLNRSLRYNVAFGGALDPRSVHLAVLDSVIHRLPDGDLTVLGERGAGISGGEARRVSLARSIRGGAEVLLADEPTADLDDVTAEMVVDGVMQSLGPDDILIVATHDPALIARMDSVIELPGEPGSIP